MQEIRDLSDLMTLLVARPTGARPSLEAEKEAVTKCTI